MTASQRGKRVLVTGGAGFIGANLVRRLSEDPRVEQVFAIDDLTTGFASNLDAFPGVLTKGSILDRDVLDPLVANVDAIVHLGARPSVPRSLADPLESNRVNVDGTLSVLEAARRQSVPPSVVFASSSSVYGANPALPKTEDLNTRPMSPYAVSKLAGESYVLAYGHCYQLRVLPFRFFNVFGPLQAAGHAYAAAVPAFVRAALDHTPLVIHGDGKQTRDFTYVGTVVEVLTAAALGSMVSDRPVNLAFGTRSSLLEVISLIESELGYSVERSHTELRAGDVKDSQADGTALSQLFPDVVPVDLATGLRATVEWMKSNPVQK
jgi:UDP-glucose 4-epimerase